MTESAAYKRYVDSAHQASELVNHQDYEKALAILRELAESNISEIDKAMMCLNVAVVYDKMGEIDEVLKWYDQGIEYETPHRRFLVLESKAAFLAEKGRLEESIALYKGLSKHPSLGESDKERIRINIHSLEKSLASR